MRQARGNHLRNVSSSLVYTSFSECACMRHKSVPRQRSHCIVQYQSSTHARRHGPRPGPELLVNKNPQPCSKHPSYCSLRITDSRAAVFVLADVPIDATHHHHDRDHDHDHHASSSSSDPRVNVPILSTLSRRKARIGYSFSRLRELVSSSRRIRHACLAALSIEVADLPRNRSSVGRK
jgi:hypothetical protein